MLGKASPKMLEVYRFLAENTERIAQLKHAPFYDGDNCISWRLSEGLGLSNARPKEMEKIPAVVLTARGLPLGPGADPQLHPPELPGGDPGFPR